MLSIVDESVECESIDRHSPGILVFSYFAHEHLTDCGSAAAGRAQNDQVV
jgi:hypothetical protein